MARAKAARTHLDADIVAVRAYSRAVKIACDELHDDPFGLDVRAQVLKLIVEDSVEADDVWVRVMADISATL